MSGQLRDFFQSLGVGALCQFMTFAMASCDWDTCWLLSPISVMTTVIAYGIFRSDTSGS